ncbi:unnamed protein product [Lepidochelys kempii]
MEKTLKWMMNTVQEMQQSQQMERQALMTWQADQQRAVQEFIREQSMAQQQILQRILCPPVGDGTTMPGCADDPDAFLGTFEQVAMAAGWERETWALWLALYLGGEAQAAFMALGDTQARDYDTVKAAILDHVGLSGERYHQRFWAARWTEGLRPRALAQRLMDWATQWLRPAAQTIEEVMDQVVLEQLLGGLLDPVRVWVRRHQAAHMADAVRLTEKYVEAEGPRWVVKPSKGMGLGRSPLEATPKRGPDLRPTCS